MKQLGAFVLGACGALLALAVLAAAQGRPCRVEAYVRGRREPVAALAWEGELYLPAWALGR